MLAMSLFYVEPLVEDTGTAALTCPHVREDKSIFNCSHHFVQSLSLFEKTLGLKKHTLQIGTDLFISPCLFKLSALFMWEIRIGLGQVLSMRPSGVHQRYLPRNLHMYDTASKNPRWEKFLIFEASTEYHKNLFGALGGSEYGRNWTKVSMPQCQ